MALGPGAHVIAPLDVYHGTVKLLRDTLGPMGIEASFVDMSDLAAVKAAVRANTRLIWIETPSNPLLKITDIAAVAQIARDAGAMLACDNTWATPVLTQPFDLGADVIMHATTKYLGGHSDVLSGVVSVKREGEFLTRLKDIQSTMGAVSAPPFDLLAGDARRAHPGAARAPAMRERRRHCRSSCPITQASRRSTIPACRIIRATTSPSFQMSRFGAHDVVPGARAEEARAAFETSPAAN